MAAARACPISWSAITGCAANEDGIGVIEALRAEFNEDIPAVLITGDTGPEHIREIEASGLAVLHKPLQDEDLRSCLSRLALSAPISE